VKISFIKPPAYYLNFY